MSIHEIKSRVRSICEQQGVVRLDLFGSRARNQGKAGNDYDFIVDFAEFPPVEYSRRFFALLHALEDELDSPIDLMTYKSLKKKSLKERIERDRIALYER